MRVWTTEMMRPLRMPSCCRLAKSASRSAGKGRGGGRGGPARRSRLAQASGPHGEEEGEEGDGGAEAAAAEEEGVEQEGQEEPEAQGEAAARRGSRAAGEGSARGGSAAASGLQPAQRYSVRQLAKLETKPIALHKGTPLPGAMPPPSEAKRCVRLPRPGRGALESPRTCPRLCMALLTL